jgi:hypothetical protein
MPITPQSDKKKLRSVIVNDPYIQSLGFKSDFTYNRNTTDEALKAGQKQIFIYNAPSRKNYANDKSLEMVICVDISVPEEENSKADLCAEQIIALLQDYDMGQGSFLETDTQSPCALACQSGFYCVGIRFSYFVSKYNQVRTTLE